MTYQTVDNFVAGLDTRKSPLTSPAGTLTRLINAQITPGGEIAKRRAFVNIGNLSSASFGLAATESKLYTFGYAQVPPLPPFNVPGVTLAGLAVPGPPPLDIIQTDFDVFDGLIYLATYSASGSVNRHYYGNPLLETQGTAKGQYIRTYQSKVYSVNGKFLYFSAVGDPKNWTTGTGAGFINLSLQDADAELLTSIEVYYDKIAIFSTESVQVWAVDADPLQNAFTQLLRAAGTSAPRSPLQYGAGDVLFLDPSGVRSLKAKDSSNSASVSDIGSPVDPTVQKLFSDFGTSFTNKSISLLEPSVGRFWLVFPTQILVLSYFPGPKITAWSQFTLPFTVQHAVTCGGKIFIRDTANNLWLYGGVNGTTYDNCGVEVRLPFLDGKKPGHKKLFQAFDATVTGTWEVRVAYDFNNPDTEDVIGVVSQPTWNAGRFEQQGYDSHFSLRFYNNDANPATISNCAIHYEMADSEA